MNLLKGFLKNELQYQYCVYATLEFPFSVERTKFSQIVVKDFLCLSNNLPRKQSLCFITIISCASSSLYWVLDNLRKQSLLNIKRAKVFFTIMKSSILNFEILYYHFVTQIAKNCFTVICDLI